MIKIIRKDETLGLKINEAKTKLMRTGKNVKETRGILVKNLSFEDHLQIT